MNLDLDYFYSIEAEQFAFFRIPKVLIKNEMYKGISNAAKLLYGMLLDRMSLSLKNSWLDENSRVYIYYSVQELCEDLNCSKPTVVKLLAELDSVNGIGLIEKKRQGFGKPDRIYVKNFIAQNKTEEQEKVKPEIENKDEKEEVQSGNSQRLKNFTTVNTEDNEANSTESSVDDTGNDTQKLKNLTSCSQKFLPQEVKNFYANNTENNKTDLSNHLSHLSSKHSNNQSSDSEKLFIPLIISHDWIALKEKYPEDVDMLNTISAVITDTLATDKRYLRVCGNNCEADTVKKQLQKLEARHIEYVLANIRISAKPVHNIRAYLLTALYQAALLTDECINAHMRCNMRKIEQITQGQNKFNQFHQREFDDDFEKMLIANNNIT